MTAVASELDTHRANLALLAERAPVPAWVADVRERSFARFVELGFPTTRDEDWRQTNVAPLARVPFALAGSVAAPAPAAADLDRLGLLGLAGPRLILVDGALVAGSPPVALPPGLTVTPLTTAWTSRPELVRTFVEDLAGVDQQAFLSLGTAFLEAGALVEVAPGVTIAEPLQLVLLSSAGETPVVAHPRVLVAVGERASLTVVESHGGVAGGQRLVNAVTQAELAPGAALRHVKVVRETETGSHVGTVAVHQQRDSRFASAVVVLAGALVRHEVAVELAGQGAEADLLGLYLGGGRRHVECRTFVDHAAPRCTSRQLYKGVLGGWARGVFTGKVLVRRDAQGTNARQSNRNLILSDRALAHAKPQFEIYADDVKCAHGATIGQLDDDQLFYLRSRGIDEAAARDVLTRAFGGEVVDALEPEALRELVATIVEETLPALLAGAEAPA